MVTKSFKKSLPAIIIFGVFSLITLVVFYQLLSVDKRLPIYSPSDVNPKLVDASVKHIQVNHSIANFSLTNQNGETITNEDYAGKIYIADFFFTRCQNICITMAYNMSELQDFYKYDEEIIRELNNICDECKKEDESVSQNLILTSYKLCSSCRVSKTIFPI